MKGAIQCGKTTTKSTNRAIIAGIDEPGIILGDKDLDAIEKARIRESQKYRSPIDDIVPTGTANTHRPKKKV